MEFEVRFTVGYFFANKGLGWPAGRVLEVYDGKTIMLEAYDGGSHLKISCYGSLPRVGKPYGQAANYNFRRGCGKNFRLSG